MLARSVELAEAVEKYSQYVTPKVVARFGDNRFLENVKVQSSNQYYSDAISGYDPDLYWKFYDKEYVADSSARVYDYSGKNNAGVVFGNARSDFSFSYPIDRKIEVYNDTFERRGSAADEYRPPFISNVNRNRWTIVNESGEGGLGISLPYDYTYMSVTTDVTKKFDYNVIETGGVDGTIHTFLGAYGSGNSSVVSKTNQGLVIRFVDEDNYIFIYIDKTSTPVLKVLEVVNGIPFTEQVVSGSGIGSFNIKIIFVGSILKFFSGSTFVTNITLNQKNINPKATKHGLAAKNINITPINIFDSTQIAWDYLIIDVFENKDYSIYSSNAMVECLNPIFSYDKKLSFGVAALPDNYSGQKILASFSQKSGSVVESRIKLYLDGGAVKLDLKGKLGASAEVSYNITHTPSPAFSVGDWHNYIVTIDNAVVKLYIDGAYVGQITNYSDDTYLGSINKVSLFNEVSAGAQQFAGAIDDFFIVPDALSTEDVDRLQKRAEDVIPFDDGRTFFSGDQALNIIEEETFPYIAFDSLDELGGSLKSNGEFYLTGNRLKVDNKYYFLSRQRSSTSAASGLYPFEDDPYIYAKFNPAKVNKITIATGHMLSRIGDFSLSYHMTSSPQGTFTSLPFVDFEKNESVFSAELSSDIEIDEIRLTILSTENPNSRAVVHQINLYYEADISEDVINIDFSKIRDNYEATLPIGSTSANNGSISLNNVHQKYNKFNTESPYYGYIEPEIKLSLKLVYEIEERVFEEIPLGESLFVDSWSMSSDNMSADISFTDWSVILQELTATSGFIFEDLVAGRAIRDIVRKSGLPSRKIKYYDSFNRTILKDRPFAYWRLSDSERSQIKDEGGIYNASFSGSSLGIKLGALPIVMQERQSDIDNDSRTLAALYGITSTSVGLEPMKSSKMSYATTVDASGLSASDFPVIQTAGDDNSALGSTGNFTLEAVINPLAINSGEEQGIISKVDSTNNNYYVYVEKSSSSEFYYVKASLKTSTGVYSCQQSFSEQEFINKVFHIVFTKNNNKIELYVNGNKVETQIEGTVTLASSPLRIFRKNTDSTSKSFNGTISHVAFYKRALSVESVQQHYQIYSFTRIQNFPYLYFFDSTYWEGLLEFATADVGMFYFDEYSNFIYEYKNAFHEPEIASHSEVQHLFKSDVNIINASHVLEIQTNKIVVKVNPKSRISSGVQSLWRAESGESLAITKLLSSIGVNDQAIEVQNTENPIWPRSGYLKIDDEIIKYNNREINRFIELERGQFGTVPAAHLIPISDANLLCRETRVYDFQFSEKPAIAIRYPFIIAQIYEGRVDIDKFESTPFGGKVIVSASDSALNEPATTSNENNLIFLEGENPLTGKQYFFSIAGIPLVEKVSEEKVEDQSSELPGTSRRLRPKEMTIDSKFIQTSPYARDVANFILSFFGTPVPVIELECIGVPFLQLGDLVKIESMPDLNIENKLYWIIETSISYDGGLTQSFMLRESNYVI